MAKIIQSNELAFIVSGLLCAPERVGELADSGRFCEFMERLGGLVAEFCGGRVTGSDDADESLGLLPTIAVRPDESMPSLRNNVWSMMDVDEDWGVVHEFMDIACGNSPSLEDFNDLQREIVSAMLALTYVAN